MAKLPDGWIIHLEPQHDVIKTDSDELILCKHCKHYKTLDCPAQFYVMDPGSFFCAKGEKVKQDG